MLRLLTSTRHTRCAVSLSLLMVVSASVSAQDIAELAFQDQPIVDILLVLARASGETIVPDETVSGRASYYFDDTDFETALRVFLDAYGLQVWREEEIYYVSRVRAVSHRETGRVTIRANDAPIETVVPRLARAMDMTVLYDRLPNEVISVNAVDVPPETALEIVTRRFPDFELISESDYFYIRRVPLEPSGAATAL